MNAPASPDGDPLDIAASTSTASRRLHGTHPMLDLRRPFRASIPDSSVPSVRKVARLDARTHVIAGRQPGGAWYRLRDRTRFTRDAADRLRSSGVSEVLLRRRFARASFPLGWLSQR